MKSNRDAWVYNFSRQQVAANMQATISYFNAFIPDYAAERAKSPGMTNDEFGRSYYSRHQVSDATKISWDVSNRSDLSKQTPSTYVQDSLRVATYRPFTKQTMYLNRTWNNRVYQMPRVFPSPTHPNIGFYVVNPGSGKPFSALLTDVVPDLAYYGSNAGQFFARYRYEAVQTGYLFVE